jgi:hypothetical protein
VLTFCPILIESGMLKKKLKIVAFFAAKTKKVILKAQVIIIVPTACNSQKGLSHQFESSFTLWLERG